MPSQTFDFTGSVQSMDVSDAQTIAVEINGAGGQPGRSIYSSGGPGGTGAYLQADIDVSNYNTIDIYVPGGYTEFFDDNGSNWGYHNGGNPNETTSELGGYGAGSAEIVLGGTGGHRFASVGGGGGGGCSGDSVYEPHGGSGGGSGGAAGSGDGADDGDPGDGSLTSGGAGGDGAFEADGEAGGDGTVDILDSTYIESSTSTTGGGNDGHGQITVSYTLPPDPPENVTIDRVGLAEIDLSWGPPSTGSTVDEYRIEYSKNGGSWTALATTPNTSYTHTGVAQDTDYQYRVRSENSGGSSDWVQTTTRTSGGKPKSFVVGGATADSIDLSWTNPAGDWDTIEVYRDTTPHSSIADYSLVQTESSGSWTDTGLVNGRTYHYRLVAVYFDADSDPTADNSATTDLPAPTIDSSTGGNREVDLTISINDNNPDGDYDVERDGAVVATVTDLTQTSYTDTGTDLDGELYSHTIVRNTPDASASSTTVDTVTILPAPTNLTVDAITATSADLSWTDNHNYGETEVQFKQSDAGSWNTFSSLPRTTEVETVTGLLNGEQYDARVVATTEHSTTEDV